MRLCCSVRPGQAPMGGPSSGGTEHPPDCCLTCQTNRRFKFSMSKNKFQILPQTPPSCFSPCWSITQAQEHPSQHPESTLLPSATP